MQNFSTRLARWRTERGFTQEQAGEALGVSGKYIGMLERGEKQVQPGNTLDLLLTKLEHNQRWAVPAPALQEPRVEYRFTPRGLESSVSLDDALAQIRADLLAIERGSPMEQRRAFVFLKEVHLPLLGMALDPAANFPLMA